MSDRVVDSAGRHRWLRAGQDLLREGGSPAVKLERLTRLTGLTTGSFYHHFSGMSEYLDALAGYYGSEQVNESLDAIADEPPRERLRRLARLATDLRMQPLDAAMRDWAGSSAAAADAVAAADAALLEFVTRAFADLGHSRDEARVRALMLLSVGVARLRPPWRLPRSTTDRVLAILTTTGD